MSKTSIYSFLFNTHIDTIILFYNKNITKLTNVYQEKFVNNAPSGLGDFIRGSLFLLQYCEYKKLKCEISLKNHIISKFLKNVSLDNKYINDMSILRYKDTYMRFYDKGILNKYTVIKKFLKYIESTEKFQGVKDGNLNINLMCFPLYSEISRQHKNYIKQVFEANDIMKQYILDLLTSIQLKPNNYNIIHVRCGDEELVEKKKNINLYIKICHMLDEYLTNNTQILLISDSTNLKNYIKELYPCINIFNNKLSHTGEGVENTDDDIKSILTDFYFITHSNNVLALSIYEHGSGFSKWISVVYDIPYTCLLIK
jgi:hypothetical protein